MHSDFGRRHLGRPFRKFPGLLSNLGERGARAGLPVVIDRAHLPESVLAEARLATGESFGSRSGANLPKPGFPFS